MRQIEFRGKLAHIEKWVKGILIISNKGNPYIYPQNVIEEDGHHVVLDTDEAFWVVPETVEQFTGLTDKNGVKIFEGDIVKFQHNGIWEIFSVIWEGVGFSYKPIEKIYTVSMIFSDNEEAPEVIGNIHDNPELLKPEGT